MGKRDSSIRRIIIISFIVLMVSTLLIIGYIVFSSWKTSVDNIIVKMENSTNQKILQEIDHLLYLPYFLNTSSHNLIENGIVDIDDPSERDAFLVNAIQSSNKNIYSVSYGLENGDFYGARRDENNEIELYRSNEETHGHSYYYSVTEDMTEGDFVEDYGKFDPRIRSWYFLTKKAGQPLYTPLYKHFIRDDLVLTNTYPIFNDDGTLQGVLGARIALSSLHDFLKEILKDRMATAYIVERKTGNLVATSVNNQSFEKQADGTLKRISINSIENNTILDAYQHYKKSAENKTIEKTDHGNLHIKLTDYKKDGVDWVIITAISDQPFLAEINKEINTAIILSIIALLLSMLIYKKVTDVILKPIHHLSLTAEKFSKGELLQRANIYKNDEIGKLSLVFNHMAEQLHKHIHHLEEKVKERTTEIEKANKELKYAKIEAEKANEAKSEFLANMSHEIRTPLNAVIGFSELLQNSIEDEKQQNYIKTINSSGNSLLRIINDILDLSKIEAGKIEPHHKQVNLQTIFKEIESMFIQTIQSKQIEFIVDIPDDFPKSIVFDEVRMRQILLNLVGNAVKFTEKGHIKLSIKAMPSNTGDRNLINLHLFVQDTGIGIPDHEKEKIFEAFTQISGQSIKKYGGTGLGLSITKKLVEILNGKITVESEVGKGSTFHIEFTDVQITDLDSLPEHMDNSFLCKYNFEGTTILVVDDIETNRSLLVEYLSKTGSRVLVAENGLEALQVAELEKPDLIITDLLMPVMNGFEAITRLRENPVISHIPVIALSATVSQDVPEIRKFDSYLMKPVNIGQLLDTVSSFILTKTGASSNSHRKDPLLSEMLDPIVLMDVRNQLNPIFKKLESGVIISVVKTLAEQIMTLGQAHQSQVLISEGKELMSYVESYQIVNIKNKIKSIEKLLLEDNSNGKQ
ncbi:ATP-binding protein [Ureibacillus composti]|nr:ATP-binding protein [Ureibacillus composti]